MDTVTSDIRAVEFAPSGDGDRLALLEQIPDDEAIGIVTAYGAYGARRCHTAIIERQASAILPTRKSEGLWKEDGSAAVAQNDILRAMRHFGRASWKR